MPQLVESLESRRFFSTVTLAAAEAALATDVSMLAVDARHAKGALIAAAKTFAADVNTLHLKNGPLKSALQHAVISARAKIQTDVTHIISAGYKDGQAVVTDVLHITLFDTGNATKIARYQKRLGADVKTLRTLETPLINKLSSDVASAISQINSAVQAIVAADSSKQSLQTDWTNLSSAFSSAQQTLTPELTNVISDLDALSTAT